MGGCLTAVVFLYDAFICDNSSSPCKAAFPASHFDIRIRVLGAPSNLRTITKLNVSHVIDFTRGSGRWYGRSRFAKEFDIYGITDSDLTGHVRKKFESTEVQSSLRQILEVQICSESTHLSNMTLKATQYTSPDA
jgi:hypothetical protein